MQEGKCDAERPCGIVSIKDVIMEKAMRFLFKIQYSVYTQYRCTRQTMHHPIEDFFMTEKEPCDCNATSSKLNHIATEP